MRIHIIIHAAFEKPGLIETWAVDKGYQLSFTHTYQGEQLPDVSEMDFLIIMGGPQSPLKLDKYPYLRDEISLTKQAIQQKKAVLGICLGAQIIGESLGVKTGHSPNKEIGMFPITMTHEGATDPVFKRFPKTFDVVHWHNDMPGIPPDGVMLAHSEGCPTQAFRYQDRVYGLQFHMEMTSELLHGMVEHCHSDLTPGKYIQTKERLLVVDTTAMNKRLIVLLDYLAECVILDRA